ncbi:MAG: hypothetical protein ACRCVT_09265 [Leadbetterella sp.]
MKIKNACLRLLYCITLVAFLSTWVVSLSFEHSTDDKKSDSKSKSEVKAYISQSNTLIGDGTFYKDWVDFKIPTISIPTLFTERLKNSFNTSFISYFAKIFEHHIAINAP